MLSKVFEAFSASFRLIIKNPIFIYLYLSYAVINFAVSWGNGYFPQFMITLLSFLAIFAHVAISLVIILFTLHLERRIVLETMYPMARAYFWKFTRQFFAGLFLGLVYASPVFCLVILSTLLDNKFPFWVLLFLLSLVLRYLCLGSISIAQRILLEKGGGVFENSIRGLRIINESFAYYLTLILLQTFLSTAILLIHYSLGSAITGVDLFPAQHLTIVELLINSGAATHTPVVSMFDLVVAAIISPLTSIVITHSYIHFQVRVKYRIPYRRPSF